MQQLRNSQRCKREQRYVMVLPSRAARMLIPHASNFKCEFNPVYTGLSRPRVDRSRSESILYRFDPASVVLYLH